ncbi:PAP2 domain-containing protein [Myriangium duriaei CBS 260.36]|uniref:PAP2 domain-containing protein n=1 Tax=Myriangium duriaei CBS 260.36 TaxID=1168546 RepID=A0A9P4J301_9PEZI|nr:PAP2 domain-containing protein [Myriangium duriaei CBS 260.36]
MQNTTTVGMEKAQLSKNPDAGLRAHDHYVRRLPPWRFRLRQSLLPIVRWETPYLARMQDAVRTPALDSYFASTANLGTHTFFMIFLPLLFWCGQTTYGRALVHMLAAGVFWSGWVKDLLCLPRPLSPPLQRITMSGSTALEYGFPSTHSTNAVSVAVYLIYDIQTGAIVLSEPFRILALIACCWYAISIVFGRLYCGMHGFSDVIVGSALGAIIAGVQIYWGPAFDEFISQGAWTNALVSVIIILLAVRFHPEPADNCPCFDDSVSFAGVNAGIEIGQWHFAKTSFAWDKPVPGTVPFDMSKLGVIRIVLRLLVGVVIVFIWRAVAKPFLLKVLPPLFRQIENVGLTLPRRFFKRASQYTKVPTLLKDDNVIPPAREIPKFISSLGKPRRRTVSIGPQSEADAREMLAQREIQRKESLRSLRSQGSNGDIAVSSSAAISPLEVPSSEEKPKLLGHELATQASPYQSDSEQEKVVFEGIEKPRVRYDVEVVTKLVVYAGIAWLSTEGNPILFTYIGLGL